MIPREILKKVRQIELRTNRLVSESLSGRYHSAFKGQGMDFDEVREYQPGDEVRSIDWNVTARMNHPFVKKFVEERELTVMLLVDVSASGWFGSGAQSKRELAAEIASVLAFSAIRNQDKVGVLLYTDTVEKYIPPRKGKRHVLRVIREVLCFEPKSRGTDLKQAMEFLNRVITRHAIVVLISDFLEQNRAGLPLARHERKLPAIATAVLRQANRRHDVVAVQITDRHEMELPKVGRLVLRDAESGKMLEVNTQDEGLRRRYQELQEKELAELSKFFRSLGIDAIRLRTDEAYSAGLAAFFETREKRRRHG